MDRAVREVHELLGMSRHEIAIAAEECRVLAFAGAPSSPEWLENAAAEAVLNAAPDTNIHPEQASTFVRRVVEGCETLQPHLDADVGVRRRSQPRGDAAKRGERLEDSGGRRVRCVGRRERSRLNGLGGDQRPAGNRHLLEGLARDRAGGGNASRRTRSTERENRNNTGERSYPHVLLRTPV